MFLLLLLLLDVVHFSVQRDVYFHVEGGKFPCAHSQVSAICVMWKLEASSAQTQHISIFRDARFLSEGQQCGKHIDKKCSSKQILFHMS